MVPFADPTAAATFARSEVAMVFRRLYAPSPSFRNTSILPEGLPVRNGVAV